MKEIKKFSLSNLRNEEHFGFMSVTNELILKETPEKLGVSELFERFTEALLTENAALEKVKGNAKTEILSALDRKRNNIERGFELLIDAYIYCDYDSTVCQHAKNMKVVLKHYNGIRRKNYAEKSSTIYNLIQDLQQRCADDLEKIPEATKWIEQLEIVNGVFITTMGDRFDDEASEIEVEIRKVRQEIDRAYTLIIDAVNVFTTLYGEDDYIDFIRAIKPRIDYCTNLIAQRKGRSKAKKRKEEEEKALTAE